MLIWINGPFGGGKTQTAHELHRRLPGSVICDPEAVGFGLHAMLPPGLRGDFQDLRAWRQGVFEVLDLTLEGVDGPVIAPMTLVDPMYFQEVSAASVASGTRCTTSPCWLSGTWSCGGCGSGSSGPSWRGWRLAPARPGRSRSRSPSWTAA